MSDAEGRWAEISALFDELVELAPSARARRLADIARNDAATAAELGALLAADDDGNALLDAGAASAVPTLLDDAAPTDRRAGPYRLLRKLGEGGMGVVWLAERSDGSYEQHVAVKLLKRGMDTHAILRRFLQERSILARLSHPYIVRLLDGGMSADGRPFYVMEHVDGDSITQFAAQRKLDVRARVDLLASIADAVAYAHTQLVVHRDLKPSNVLVDVNGTPRVLDFGIAKVIETTGEETRTGTGLRVLSPAYAAPEQMHGGSIGTAVDVYALGLMLFELLVGELPQRHTPAQADVAAEGSARASVALARLANAQVTDLYGAGADGARIARAVAGDIDVIIATALRHDPAQRYATAAAFSDDLRRWLEGRPIAARAESATYRFLKFVRRHRVGVAASILVALSILGGLGGALWQAHKAGLAADAARVAEQTAQQQAAIANAVSDFLARDVIQAVNPYRNKLDIRLSDALIGAGKNIDARFAGNPRLAGVVRRELGESLYLAGEVEAAHAQAKQALDTLEHAFGIADADALEARVAYARVLHGEDNYAEARALYEAGLAAIGAQGSRRTRLELAVGLAGIDVEERHEEQALKSLEVLVPQVEAEVGAFEPLHIDALNDQMRGMIAIERKEEALGVARRLRSGTEKKFGGGNVQTLEWIKREGIILTGMDRFDEALPIMQQACTATRASLGEAHYATHDCNLRLGVVLFYKERYADAAELFKPVVAYRDQALGADAENTWISWIWLARAYQHTNRLKEARALFERASESANRVHGENNPVALPFGQTLGMFLEQTGAHADAEKIRRDLLGKARAALPEGNINIVKYAWDLGETLASEQHDKETIEFYAEWLPQWDRTFPADDSRRLDAHKWLAQAQARRTEQAGTKR
jgi:tRNA A-37 threonylcarbamoyl transferase component Bud32/tetratricopeptide (TPR) repeat protein